MAVRPVFLVNDNNLSFESINVDFEWYKGLSLTQKKRNVLSLHYSFLLENLDKKVLEISSKSMDDLGIKLSAFNLKYKISNELEVSVENIYQGSKVFENGIQYPNLYYKSSMYAKKFELLKTSGNIVGYKLFDEVFPNKPETFFYNWIYINALVNNEYLSKQILKYDAFTDIIYNPKKSINCQARAAAIYVTLYRNNMLEKALSSKKEFLDIVYSEKNF